MLYFPFQAAILRILPVEPSGTTEPGPVVSPVPRLRPSWLLLLSAPLSSDAPAVPSSVPKLPLSFLLLSSPPSIYIPPPDRSIYPETIGGGLIRRFQETPELVSYFPGGLLGGNPTGVPARPYAMLTYVGGEDERSLNFPFYYSYSLFLISVSAKDSAGVSRGFNLLKKHFNPHVISDNPIELREGRIRSVRIKNTRINPSSDSDRGGNMVRRGTSDLLTTSYHFS